jgi:O-glycosyl hydrolase
VFPVCILAFVTVVFAGEPQAADVTVDWQDTHQTIVGFGGTMGWIHPGERVREEVFDLLFTKLGASVLRIRALGGEGDDELSIEPKNDNDDPNAFNWPAFPVYLTEAKNAVIIKAALARGVGTVVPTSWSPPAWMKTTGRRAGGGGGTLKESMIEEFAEAWAAYVIGMKREFEIEIRTLSIQNEPDLTWYYPTCGFTPALYARAVRAIQARLDREKLKVSVLGPDVCRIYNLPRYLEKLDEAGYEHGGEGRKTLPVLTHLYDLSIDYGEVEKDVERWRAARDLAREHGRRLWFMETANYLSVDVKEGSFEEAIIWARKIHHALADGDCEVVCYWSLFFDKIGESLVFCRETGLNEYTITPKFYSSMNYFRFVRPGMRRVTTSSADPGLFVTAFVGERSRVVVIVNWADATKTVRLPVAANEAWERFETTASRKCGRVQWTPPATELPPRSVTTFVRTARREISPE